MRPFVFISLLTLIFKIPAIVFGQLSEDNQIRGLKYAGLTKTLTNILETRPLKSFTLGSYEISIEDMIDADITSLFDCDSLIGNYLSEAGEESTYEMLSEIMSNAIRNRFRSEEGYLFVNVYSDTISEGMHFNFSIFRDKPVTIPVVLNASDTSFSTFFDTTCTVKFEADIDIFININKVNSGLFREGIGIRINRFLLELSSDTDNEELSDCYNEEETDISDYTQKPLNTIPFEIEGKKYKATTRCFSISANSYWYLSDHDADDFVNDEEQFYILSYKQLEKGKFKWDNPNLSSFSLGLIMIPEGEHWDSVALAENRSDFFYTIEDLFDDKSLEQISLCCDYWVKEGVTARNKKFILKR